MSDITKADYEKLSAEYRILQNKYHSIRIMLEQEQKRDKTQKTEQIKALIIQRDAAREQLRKYAHATKLIMSAKNMLEMACDYLEAYDD
jgi:hypothetical protein